MTLALATTALVLFGGVGAALLRSEERDLRAVSEKEALLLGRSLQTAFENALRDRQIEDVTETLGALAKVDPTVAIFVFDEEGRLVGASDRARASPKTVEVEGRARRRLEPVLEHDEADGDDVLRVGLRLRDETPDNSSAIVLEKPLAELRRDLLETRERIVQAVVGFVLVVAGLTWVLSKRHVGRPLTKLVGDMKRVRSGDLRIESAKRSEDEVGEALVAFDELVRELAEARAVADQEQEARRRIERGLEHADKLITLGQLSAVMAHEIGSPLQILEGRARALMKHPEDSAATRRTAEMLVEQTARITGIVGQMLSITRRRLPRRSQLDAEPLVRRVAALVEFEARRRSITIAVRSEGSALVSADPDQLQQVALNLLRNALDASSDGESIEVTVGGSATRFELIVEDRGAGLTNDAREHVFEPFYTTKADRGGSGLGLSVVRSIVLEHDGTVGIEPVIPNGCRVRVSIPRHHEDVAA